MRGKSIVARASPPFRAASGLQRIRRAIAATLAGLAVVTWQDPARADDFAPTEADRTAWTAGQRAPWLERVPRRKVEVLEGEPFAF